MLVKPCSLTLAPNNTGYDCTARMGAPVLLIMVPQTAVWTATNETAFLSYIQQMSQAPISQRWYPLFGLNAPLRTINDAKESDVIVDYEDGSKAFIRNGTYTRTFMTNQGGLSFAKAILSFNKFRKYAFIEVDKDNNVLRRDNGDGTFSGLRVNTAYAPAADLATLKTEFVTAFALNFTVNEYIGKSTISTSTEDLRYVTGLIDSAVSDAGSSTATKLRVQVKTIGTQLDLLALFPTLLTAANFVVTKVADGSTVTVSAVAASSTPASDGSVIAELTVSTQTSGTKLSVGVVPANTLYSAQIIGYDVINPVVITTP
jgi:hypothetical protein